MINYCNRTGARSSSGVLMKRARPKSAMRGPGKRERERERDLE